MPGQKASGKKGANVVSVPDKIGRKTSPAACFAANVMSGSVRCTRCIFSITTIILIFFQSVCAQSQILIEACNNIENSGKRLLCLQEAMKDKSPSANQQSQLPLSKSNLVEGKQNHSQGDDGRFPVDYDKLAKMAKDTDTIIEINCASLKPTSFRLNGLENITKLIESCKKQGTMVVVNSDAHFSSAVGRLENGLSLLEEYKFPKELILNYNEELILKNFDKHSNIEM